MGCEVGVPCPAVSQAVLTLVTALSAAALTGITALGAVWFQERRRERAAMRAELRKASAELLWRSLALMQAVSTLGFVAAGRIASAVDPLDYHDRLAKDWYPVFEAWSTIWLHGDQQWVRHANDVVTRCLEIMNSMKDWPRLEDEHSEAVKQLGEARKRFANYCRTKLGVDDVPDLFAGVEGGQSGI